MNAVSGWRKIGKLCQSSAIRHNIQKATAIINRTRRGNAKIPPPTAEVTSYAADPREIVSILSYSRGRRGNSPTHHEHPRPAGAPLRPQPCPTPDFTGLFVVFPAPHLPFDSRSFYQLTKPTNSFLNRLAFTQDQFDHPVTSFLSKTNTNSLWQPSQTTEKQQSGSTKRWSSRISIIYPGQKAPCGHLSSGNHF